MPNPNELIGKLRNPVVPLVVLVAVLLAVGGNMLSRKNQELAQTRNQRDLARQQIAEQDARIQDLENQLQTTRNEIAAREERLTALRNQLTVASKDLEHSRSVFQDMQSQYETLVKERDQLQTQIASVNKERDGLRERSERAEEAARESERSVGRMRERLALLDRDYRRLSDQLEEVRAEPLPTVSVIGAAGPAASNAVSAVNDAGLSPMLTGVVELPPIVVRKDQAGIMVPVRGRVLDVNGQHRFVVIDKGSVDGVRVGMTLDVVRGANTVGRVTVVRVRPQLSACDLIAAKTAGPIQAGDLVVQNGP